MKYTRFMALNYVTALRPRSNNPIKIFVNRDILNYLENPVNLHVYHYNELVARIIPEFIRYHTIMNMSPSEKANSAKYWYDDVISILKMKILEYRNMICNLNIDKFYKTLKAAEKNSLFY
jgi:hypothetical protein